MQTEFLKVTGMTCGGCTSNVTRALKTVSGVHDVMVSLATNEATVQYDERLTSPGQLKSAIEGAGYGVDATDAAHSRQSKGSCCGGKNATDADTPILAAKAKPVAPRVPERSASAKDA